MLRDLEGNSFATGCAVSADTDLTESSPKIFVRIHPRNLPAPVLAQLDTGAAWSVLNVEIARRIGVLDAQGEPLALSTRTGKVLGMRGRQIDRVRERLLEGQRALGQARRERLSLDVLHHQEVDAVLITDVVERADVWVIQRGDRARFALESFAGHRIHMEQRRQDFDGDGSGQPSVTALVDLPLPPDPRSPAISYGPRRVPAASGIGGWPEYRGWFVE